LGLPSCKSIFMRMNISNVSCLYTRTFIYVCSGTQRTKRTWGRVPPGYV
jgi:hypothetical protein